MSEILNWKGLPETFKRLFVRKLDFENRCSLRECSKTDRDLVDSLPYFLEFIRIKKDETTYEKFDLVVSENGKLFKQHTTDEEYVIRNFFRLISHPKSRWEDIIVDVPFSDPTEVNFYQKLAEKSKKLGAYVKTQSFFWYCHENLEHLMLEFFKKLDPIFLKRLYLDVCLTEKVILKLMKTEQWSKIKELSVSNNRTFPENLTIPLEKFLIFDSVQIYRRTSTTEEALMVVENFRVNSRLIGSFFNLGIANSYDTDGILRELAAYPMHNGLENLRVLPMIDKEKVLLLTVSRESVSGVVHRKNEMSEDLEPKFKNWSEHITRVGDGFQG